MSERNDGTDRSGDSSVSNGTTDPQEGGRGERGASSSTAGALADRFTETFVRLAVAIVGLTLLLLALSQIVGVDLYSVVGAVLASRIGRWLLVAIFGLGLIVAASKRWSTVRNGTES